MQIIQKLSCAVQIKYTVRYYCEGGSSEVYIMNTPSVGKSEDHVGDRRA